MEQEIIDLLNARKVLKEKEYVVQMKQIDLEIEQRTAKLQQSVIQEPTVEEPTAP